MDVASTNKGILVPRVAGNDQINSPAEGLIIYNLGKDRYEIFDGSNWLWLVQTVATSDNLSMSSNKIVNLSPGTVSSDAVNKGQLDSSSSTVDSNNLDRDGTDTMTGNLNMNSNKISNVSNATATTDAINLGQVQTRMASTIVKIVNIGTWDMFSNREISINHGLGGSWKNIRGIDVIVRNDDDNEYRQLNGGFETGTGLASEFESSGGIVKVTSTQITLRRKGGTEFGSVDWNATGYNRGWVKITTVSSKVCK